MQSSLTVLVEFEQSDYFVCEDVQLLMVCAVITGGNIFSFTLETGTSGTAIGTCRVVVMYPWSYLHVITAGEDYLEVNKVIVGDSLPCVNITIVDDMDRESCENFSVVLSTSDPNVILSLSTSTITIYDNEGLIL